MSTPSTMHNHSVVDNQTDSNAVASGANPSLATPETFQEANPCAHGDSALPNSISHAVKPPSDSKETDDADEPMGEESSGAPTPLSLSNSSDAVLLESSPDLADAVMTISQVDNDIGRRSEVHNVFTDGQRVARKALIEDGLGMHLAAMYGHAQIVRVLARAGASIKKLDDVYPLHTAAFHGHAETLQALLELGPDIETTCQDGFTAMHVAAQTGHTECVRVLARADANVNATSQDGTTAMHLTTVNGHTEALASVEKRCRGLLPLHTAAASGQPETLQTLIVLGANIDGTAQDGFTAMHVAAQEGHTECVQVLARAGANVNATLSSGTTPIHVAAQDGHTECVRVLTRAGANVNATISGGFTAMHIAAQDGHAECVQVLARAGANVNATSAGGATPMYVAARFGQTECVRVLIEARADSERHATGTTPLCIAAYFNHKSIFNMLVERGASLRDFGTNGVTLSFDTVIYHNGMHYSECVICGDDFKEGETLVRLRCGHMFRRWCLLRMVALAMGANSRRDELSIRCPCCRENLLQ